MVERFGWRCLAYCLMGNHYHLLIQTPLPNLSLGMRQLNGVYAQRFNRRHTRVGHVFQARFHAVLVESGEHLLEIARYLVLNPLRARIVAHPAQWQWSSYRATAGLDTPAPFLHTDALLVHFDGPADPRLRYQRFVAAGTTSEPPAPIGEIYLGSSTFARQQAPNTQIEEVPRPQWQPIPPGLEQLFAADPHRAPLTAYKNGYTIKQISDHLGVHYSTVSRRLRQLERTG